MAYYYGKFRNIDTSIDPLGQEYKVVIFTNYDGSTSPYGFNPITEQPDLGTELVMTATPFTVSYQNEDGNIYKPYKCSTATVSFLMSTLNLDLFTNKENNILVALLKRDNDIVLRGDTYINKNTDEVVIRKRSYGLFYGFLPSEVDTNCYKVEWIGYATPNTYNQNYTLVEQEFQLECQDAFSTLKYDGLPFNNLVEVRDVKTVINLVIGQLGTYKHIYYPSTLTLPDINNESTSFIKIVQQYRNFIEDNDEPISKIELIEAIGAFLNVSFVPFKDSVYIVNYEGVAGNINNYYNYSIVNNNNLFFNYRTDNPTWNDSVLENIENNLELTKDCYAGDDTNITMQSVYSNFKVQCDESEVDLMPDLSDSKNFDNTISTPYTPSPSMELYSNHRDTYQKSIVWRGGVISDYKQNNEVGFKSYIYNANFVNDNYSDTEEEDYDDNYDQDITHVIHARYKPQNPSLIPDIFHVDDANIANYNNYYCGCVNLKNTKIKGFYTVNPSAYNKDTDERNNVSFPNDFVFWNRNNFSELFPSYTIPYNEYSYFFNANHQVVLEYQSPKFILTDKKRFQIKGDWMFFCHTGFTHFKTDNINLDNSTPIRISKDNLYITAQIIFTVRNGVDTKYFRVKNNPTAGSPVNTTDINDYELYTLDITNEYEPVNTYKWRVHLPLNDDDDSVDMSKPFGQWIPFKNTRGDNSGLVIDTSNIYSWLNSTQAICDVRVRIMCPLGVGVPTAYGWADSSIVRNLEFSIVDTNEIEQWGYGDCITDFHNNLNKNLDTFEIDNKLSTNQFINKLSYNYCFKVYNNYYFLLDNLCNQATGIIGRPEILKLADIYNQYRDKTIGLNTTLWENLGITPNTRVKWNNRNFIVDKQEIDYELNRNTISLIEKKLRSDIPEIEAKMYLENENGQTLNLNPFYNETFNPVTVNSYSRNESAVIGETNNQINSAISFYPTWSDGIEAWVSIPEILLDDISVSINNNGELIIGTV